MPPLFATKYDPNYQGTMAIGPVTMSWQEWSLVLLFCTCVFTLLSAYWAWRSGRWWLTLPIAVLSALGVDVYTANRRFGSSDGDFEYVAGFFLFALPLVIVHAVVSFAMPRCRPSPAEPAGRYNSP